MSYHNCPVCLHKCEEENITKINNFPLNLWPIEVDLPPAPITIAYCLNCGHAFQIDINQLQEEIYSTVYQESPLHADDFRKNFQTKDFDEFMSAYLNDNMHKGKKLLEVGCGTPSLLEPYAQKGFYCTGVEPSPKAETVYCEKNIRIISDYIENVQFEDTFDVIIMRFCLEHIYDVESLLRRCKNILSQGGSIFIHVPNNETDMRTSPLYAAHEHFHYFTRQSLDTLAVRLGLSIKNSNHHTAQSLLGHYILENDWKNKYLIFDQKVKKLNKDFGDFYAKHREIVFYGYGLPYVWISTNFDLTAKHFYLIDDEPILQGKKINHTSCIISSLKNHIFTKNQVVLLTLNQIYHTNVCNKLRDFGICNEIYGITEDGICQLN